MVNILLTGGRSPAALELARVFATAGHRVFMAESQAGHLSRPSRFFDASFVVPPPRQQPEAYIEALRRLVIGHSIDLLVPTCEEIFYVAKGREILAPHCAVLAEPLEKLRVLHHKAMFVERARRHGLAVPETLVLEGPARLTEAFARWPELVLKPAYSRFASQALIRPDLETASRLRIEPGFPWVAQEFIEGSPLCTFSVAHRGRLTAHTAYRADFTAGQGASIRFRHEVHAGALAWVEKFVAAEHFTGQIAFDFIERDEVIAIECNPRATSGVHLLARSPEFATSFFDASVRAEPLPGESAMLLTAMLFYGLPAALRERSLRRWWSAVVSSRDAVFRWDDPLPFLLQARGLVTLWRQGRRYGITPLQAATHDIEWNGE
jgi:hypothetical protein